MPGLVEQSHAEMEWQVSHIEGDRSDHRLRCISDRVGHPLLSQINKRSMVMSRSNYAHQLYGTASSDLGSQVVCQVQVQDLNTAED